ncbi:MAG: Zn-ribbon domain-containing OB-fold protein [Myxococcota bacterium]
MGTRPGSDGRPLPWPNPTTQPFFDAARERRLVLQRCPRDGFFFYPRSRCPTCLGADWKWEEVAGRGRVHAFTVDRVGHVPALQKLAPYAIAIVELDAGPRMTARLVECDPNAVKVGTPVVAAFEDVEGTTLVHFRPA